ncbi:MAG: glycosyltransferase family 1 protein [Bacteroidota bacterium]
MNLSLFYRCPAPEYHSIEQLFDTISSNYPVDVQLKKVYAKQKSKGLTKRILIGLHARKNQSEINHITGDIHFIAPFLCKQKTILTIHDIGSIKSGNFMKKWLFKLFWFSIPAKSVAYITVISEFTKTELINYIKIDPAKVVVIPNCISPIYQFVEKEFNTAKPIILQIGTKENKNLNRLIESINGLSCKLVIIGKLSERLNHLLNINSIEYENHFNVDEEKLLRLYHESDIVSFISTYEGFGLPILEANAVGRVVITSNIEPMNTVAYDAAYKVNPFNVDEIKNGILTIIKDSSLRKKLIEQGVENAKKYNAKTIAEQYESLYYKLNNE